MEYSSLKRGDLIELCYKGYDKKLIGIVMECFLDPILYNDEHICEIYFLKEDDYVYISEAELVYWKLLSRRNNEI